MRTWHSLCYDLTLSAEHRPGGHVQRAWGIHNRAPSGQWHFETTTVHAAGEDMRSLARDLHAHCERRKVAERAPKTVPHQVRW
ncbi:DUF6228 family protein [Streptomyces sp. HMX87]|uniref:DUF6228 family protein n=1 Tax=Streptomyces sp. HMX87 TaxID=3390849 RepID=UPI003A85BE87